jgi:hypothetical protein
MVGQINRALMPRLTLKELAARLEDKNKENERLRDANARLQELLSEQADALRTLGTQPKLDQTIKASVEFHGPICFEALSDMDPMLNCSHEICRKCCLIHFASNSTCPLCRKEVTVKELWRFRHPKLSKYWAVLRGAAWPKFGDVVLITTSLHTLVGRHIATSDEKKTILILHHLAEWEIQLESVQEIYTMQHLVDNLPPREDGLRRVVANE